MSDQTGTKVLRLETAATSILTTGCRILWIMHYAATDNGEVLLSDADGGNDVFYHKNVDVSAIGNYRYFFLGGQAAKGIYVTTLTTSGKVWLGLI